MVSQGIAKGKDQVSSFNKKKSGEKKRRPLILKVTNEARRHSSPKYLSVEVPYIDVNTNVGGP